MDETTIEISCDICSSKSVCKYVEHFLSTVEKIEKENRVSGLPFDITIQCKYYNSNTNTKSCTVII